MRNFFVVIALAIFQSGFATELKLGHPYSHENLAPKYTKIFEDTINSTLECIRYTLETGLPEHNIPSVEELTLEDLFVDVDEIDFIKYSGYVHLKNIRHYGLTSFYISEIKGDLSLIPLGYKLDLTLMFKDFDLSTLYDIEVANVYGNGDLSWVMKDMSFKIHVFINLLNGVQIKDLKILLHIDSSNAVFTGWFNDEEQSQIITELFNVYLMPAWVNQQPEYIDDFISPIIQDFINSLLADKRQTRDGIIDAILEHCNAANVFQLKM